MSAGEDGARSVLVVGAGIAGLGVAGALRRRGFEVTVVERSPSLEPAGAGLAWLTRRQMGALRHGPQSWGFVEVGRLDEVRILEIIGRLGPGVHELICHPGDEDDAPGEATGRYQRTLEIAALGSPKVRRALASRGVSLCRWGELF